MGKEIKMKKQPYQHGDFQVYEDSDVDDDFNSKNWPNKKMLWWRLGACILVGLAVVVGLFIGAVMLINKILEQ